jgi:hypothetical protein
MIVRAAARSVIGASLCHASTTAARSIQRGHGSLWQRRRAFSFSTPRKRGVYNESVHAQFSGR